MAAVRLTPQMPPMVQPVVTPAGGGGRAGGADGAGGGRADGSQGQVQRPGPARRVDGTPLTAEEQRELATLKEIDARVRAHELAHLAVAGSYARGGASFTYRRGPDGRNYAVGGEVPIDTSKEATPEETIRKMRTVRAAALAPADPSPQDRRVAAAASAAQAEAEAELRMVTLEQRMRAARRQEGTGAPGNGMGAYQRAAAATGALPPGSMVRVVA